MPQCSRAREPGGSDLLAVVTVPNGSRVGDETAMYVFCLVLSVIAAALGLLALGFAVPIRDFNLGNTMIMTGAIAVVGSMIMFGLATVVNQLRRIAELLGSRPATTVVRRRAAPEVVELPPPPVASAQRPAPGARVPFPPRPSGEQRPPTAPPSPPSVEAAEALAERPRPNILGAARNAGEAPMMEEEVPLAPSRVPASPMGRGAPPAAEPPPPPEPPRPAEHRPTQADIMARLSNLAATPPRPVPRPEPPRAPPPPPPPPPVERTGPAERAAPAERTGPAERANAAADQRRANMFDALWPAEVRAARQSQSETIARATRPEPPRSDMRAEPRPERGKPRSDAKLEARLDARPEPRPEQRPEPRSDQRPEPRFEPPPAPRERIGSPGNGATREPMPPPAEPRTIAILKSGVIDGMAYTLYTDGSIEAELPQGTMRFASIDDLRSHLEKTDRQA
jgi:hypothetical protein